MAADTNRGDSRIEELRRAADPFIRALALFKNMGPPDDEGLRDWIPRIWPTVGDLRKLCAAVEQPILTQAQAERLAAGLDDRDGGHDGMVEFVWSLAGMKPPVYDDDHSPAVRVTVTVPGQVEPTAEWSRDAKGVLLQDEPGSGARALSKALAEAPGARRIVDENAQQAIALNAQGGEPVAWAVETSEGFDCFHQESDAWAACTGGQAPMALYAAPPADKQEAPAQPSTSGAIWRLIRWARVQSGDIAYSGDHPIALAEVLLTRLLAWTKEEEDHCGEFGEGYAAAQRWIAMQLGNEQPSPVAKEATAPQRDAPAGEPHQPITLLERAYNEMWAASPLLSAQPAAEPVNDASDAARYRWLRDRSEPGICAFYLSVGKAFDGVKFTRQTVDEAIDAQIGSAPQAQPSPEVKS